MKILVTGAAGFIGYHLSCRLLNDGFDVVGVDNLNGYYDVGLKQDRLAQLLAADSFDFHLLDLSDRLKVSQLFETYNFDYVVNLAAQAGVRYSLQNPHTYIDSNIVGFVNLLEGCRSQTHLKHVLFASSSSVYGANIKTPFSTMDSVDYPISLYAATKKANELIAHSYSHLYDIAMTGLRFFTVYGPWGRPDMAYFKFVNAIEQGREIDIYNFGNMQRDFTYVDDVIESISRLLGRIPTRVLKTSNSNAQYELYNVGSSNPVALGRFIEVIEEKLEKKAKKKLLPMQPGDVPQTYADIDDLAEAIGFKPQVNIEQGIEQFVSWHRRYYSTCHSKIASLV